MNHERTGLLWVLAGFCTLSIGDAVVKGMAGSWSPVAIAAARYMTGTVALAILLGMREGWGAVRLPRQPVQWLRGIAMSLSSLGMFMAVWIMPLAQATTIGFTQPIITAILAAIFLREPARRSTWIASCAAFVGVLIVLRPSFAEIGWGALFPVMGAAGMAVAIIANRAAVGTAGMLAMQFYMAVTALIVLLIATVAGHFSGIPLFEVGVPDMGVIVRCILVGFSATLAQWCIFMGTMKAGAGTVAPMTYGQLLMAVSLGWIFFGDAPDPVALLGAAIIIGAGLFLWRESRRNSRAAAQDTIGAG